MLIRKIVIIGSGNLASNLVPVLTATGKKIVCVFSRTLENARKLASLTKTNYTDCINDIPKSADLYIIATNDSAINELSDHLTGLNGIVVHTSGTVPMSVFSEKIKNHGVFYPLMTFSKIRKTGFNDIPICLEANSGGVFKALNILAKSMSNNVVEISSDKRRMLHLAAVFACNFTNLNFTIAEDLLQRNQLPFDLLKPLIMATIQKTSIKKFSLLQTGPAFREDLEVMHQHMELLNGLPQYQEMYDLLSKLIKKIKQQK
jgi:predicted short-subunit dehydrogenase-like oxidoreductase (DUF2520 family)